MTTTIPRLGRLPHDRDTYLASVSLVRQRRGPTPTVRLFLNRVLLEDWAPQRVRPVFHAATRFVLLVPSDSGRTVKHARGGTASVTLSGLYRKHRLPRIGGAAADQHAVAGRRARGRAAAARGRAARAHQQRRAGCMLPRKAGTMTPTPLHFQTNTLRRMAWDHTHDWQENAREDKHLVHVQHVADAKVMLQALRWGMLLTLAAPEWAQQVIREDIATLRREGKAHLTADEETFAVWLDHMRREWIERYPVASFGGESE